MVSYVLRFTDEAASAHDRVGGKGANLGLLTQAGFPVPPGFTVTTDAYAEFLHHGDLGEAIVTRVASLDYDRADELERVTGEIRRLVTDHPLPESIADGIVSAYDELGSDSYVAVRSSGTAEDLAEASFAGLHDTYLDIRGVDAVLDAVRRCWASLWTARATSYRRTMGFDATTGIAVVVQRMVSSEVAGVLFTANPMTAETDEIVVNASWGLGEAIVSGITTPDEYTVAHSDLRVKEKLLGSKERQVVREPRTGVGTVEQSVPEEQRVRFTLSDEQVAVLGDLGRRVQQHYGGFPQDIEWGYAEGQFHLLQSRPVTGVELSWDADCEDWQWMPEVDDDTVFTRNWSDEVWTGGVTPLMYSYRARGYTRAFETGAQTWGHPALGTIRPFRYYRGGAYYNANFDAAFTKATAWPQFRPMLLANIPPAWHQELVEAPFSVASYLRLHARCRLLDPAHGLTTWWDTLRRYLYDSFEIAAGPSDDELRAMSDRQLKAAIQKQADLESQYIVDVWTGFFVHFRDAMGALATLVAKWYTGPNSTAFVDLITGAPEKSAAMIETEALWQLAQTIRASPTLRTTFEEREGSAFFEAAGGSAEGREFLARYQEFLADHGHRGHADRDLIFTRRVEDPGVDYRALRAFMSAVEGSDPGVSEARVEQRRLDVVAEVRANIAAKSFGWARVAIFDMVLGYVIPLLKARDDQRHWVDRVTYSVKRGFLELSRRCVERGRLEREREVYFLTQRECFDVLDGVGNLRLLRAKIAGRERNFDRIDAGERSNPMYLQRGRDADFELDRVPGEELPENMFRGTGTSGGQIEGTARVVKHLSDIGRVRHGEILVVHATDPGWTPVFLVVAGIIVETGGMLAHASCLSREYGMPCVHLPKAMALVADGARVRINGDTGVVEIVTDPARSEDLGEELAAI
ncbi:MAG TPA: PEP/pyruvate-binding domain-containing protein [Pseudonocardia sp.]|nr:PEP/pyruvate-binding domain-containing protein [Pseudonocardia sp.]